ncbi:phosphate-starvation-inducible PsiE family protein [Loktanella sp. SALINAS62]|uniref:phosphate-starvation-inducible protein PsiE n=1 Tax=Loktanella sp. SALINAS62 TaxID=2706124 RepID=UPI001B8C9D3A|nr:phosphate-starvation-inducible PsiE family protein [Loktanella sp. SALINAS62]MBS1301218.1 phosphate-starvation-inducible PsiE family protein [Loktanella sp. SALINAS62]
MTKPLDPASDDDLTLSAPDPGGTERKIALRILHLIERLLLAVVVLLTIGAAALEIVAIMQSMSIALADILLMFLYAEVIGMVIVFYADRQAVFVYPIFIAITALARLIILQGKDMAPENILYEAVSILLLTLAALVIIRVRKS